MALPVPAWTHRTQFVTDRVQDRGVREHDRDGGEV